MNTSSPIGGPALVIRTQLDNRSRKGKGQGGDEHESNWFRGSVDYLLGLSGPSWHRLLRTSQEAALQGPLHFYWQLL